MFPKKKAILPWKHFYKLLRNSKIILFYVSIYRVSQTNPFLDDVDQNVEGQSYQ